MDFTSVNTPSDLVSKNEEKSPKELAAVALLQCDWADTKELVELVLEAALEWHKETGYTLFQEDDDRCLVWAKEVGTLRAVVELLKSVR